MIAKGAGAKNIKRRRDAESKGKKREDELRKTEVMGMHTKKDSSGNLIMTGTERSRKKSSMRASGLLPGAITRDINLGDFYKPRSSKGSVDDALDLKHLPIESSTKRRGIVFNLKRINAKLAMMKEKEHEEEKIRKVEEERRKRKDFNFAVGEDEHVKLVRFEEYSLNLFGKNNLMRQFFVKLVVNVWFDRIILTMITLNAIIFAITDYGYVDENGALKTAGSWQNTLNVYTNLIFVVIFTFELCAKVVAQGFYGSHGAYLTSYWNILDLVVVVTGLMVLSDASLGNISSLRMIRILRPLRSLSMLPSLRNIISSIFAAIPELSGVFTILGFLFLLFAIAGMELFGGPNLHARCRSTPYPVFLNYTADAGLDYANYKCIAGETYNLVQDVEGLTKSTSPWATPRDCYWPLAYPDAPRLCTLSGSGINGCINEDVKLDGDLWSWCGSNYDARGNRRFNAYRSESIDITYGNGFYGMNDADMYVADLNFGYSQFDNFGTAVLTIFQTITEEGWTRILYMLIDVYGPSASVPYFILLILFGVFFVLQLLLAVLEDNFSRASDIMQKKGKQEAEEKAAKVRRLKNLKNRHRRHDFYHVALIEDSVVQTKLIKMHLEGLQEMMDKEVHVDTFRDPNKLLTTYSIPEILVQFDCIILGQIQGSESVLLGSDFLGMIDRYRQKNPKPRRLHKKEPIQPYRLDLKLAITADFDQYAAVLEEAGAHVVLDKTEDTNISEALQSTILDVDGCINKYSETVNAKANKDAENEDAEAFISRRDANAMVYKTQMALDAAHKRGIRIVSFDKEGHNLSIIPGKQTFMMSLVKPPHVIDDNNDDNGSTSGSDSDDDESMMGSEDKQLNASFVSRIPCTVCKEEIVGGCYFSEESDTVVCSLCALTPWDTTFVTPGEKVNTAFGKCIVKEIRQVPGTEGIYSRVDPVRGIRPVSDFIGCIVCEPESWTLADDKPPTMYLNADSVQLPEFKRGDIVDTVYGGRGTIESVKKSIEATHYVVKPMEWSLATGKSPQMFLQRSAIHMVLEYDPENPYYHVQVKRLEDKRLKERGLYEHSIIRDIVEGANAACNDLHHCMDTACSCGGVGADGHARKGGFRRFVLKRRTDVDMRINQAMEKLGIAPRVIAATADIDEAVHADADDEDMVDDVHLLVTKDPNSFVRLPELTLEDLVGFTLAKMIVMAVNTIEVWVLTCIASCRDRLVEFSERHQDKAKKKVSEMNFLEYLKHLWLSYCVEVTEWENFDSISGGLIMINCFVLMSDHYPMDGPTTDGLAVTNAILTMLFFIEMVVVLTARGWSYYTGDYMNMFDLFVVLASVVDLSVEPPAIWGSSGAGLGSLSSVTSFVGILRCFRLFRIVKLALKVRSLKILFARIIKTFYDLNSFVLLLGLILFIYTVAGLQFFSNRFRFDEYGRVIDAIGSTEWQNAYEVSRYCFDNFSLAFASVFQILTTENWNDIMFDTWRVYGPAGVIFPCSLVLIGTFVLMNLFLGILLGNFTSDEDGVPSFEGFEISDDQKAGDAPLGRTGLDGSQKSPSSSSTLIRRMSVRFTFSSKTLSTSSLVMDSVDLDKDKEKDDSGSVASSAPSSEDMGPFRHSNPNSPQAIEIDTTKTEAEEERKGLLSLGIKDSKDRQAADEKKGTKEKEEKKSGEEKSDKEEDAQLEPSPNLWVQCCDVGFRCLEFVCGPVPSEQDDDDSEDGSSVDSDSDGVRVVERGGKIDLLSVKVEALEDDQVFPLPQVDTLGLFSPMNPVRYRCARILTHPMFEGFIQTFIFLSSIALCFDSPLTDPGSTTAAVVENFQIFTTALFTSEMVVKVVTFGFLLNERAYLRSGWNVLDFIIVIVSLIGVSTTGSALGGAGGAIKTIRVFRAFRPLRVINRAPGLRLIVNAVIESIPDVLNVVAVLIVLFSIFAVMMVNFLKGDLRQCAGDVYEANIATNDDAVDFMTYPKSWNDASAYQRAMLGPSSTVRNFASDYGCGATTENCCAAFFGDAGDWDNNVAPTSKMLCNCWGGSWLPVTFTVLDNYPIALMALFIISTTEGWVELMYAAVDARGVDMQPVVNYELGFIYFFVLFILVGSFFALNLFVGVMMDNFGRAKRMCNGQVAYMTPEQQEWVKNYKIVKSLSPYLNKKPPPDRLGQEMFKICQNPYFEYSVLTTIAFNTITLATTYFGISDTHRATLEILNTIFSSLFTVEMIMKLIAYRAGYFRSKWNCFDFIVTIGTDIGVVVFWTTGNDDATVIILIRIFRVLRVVRLVEGLSYAKRLIDTLVYTLPGIINITVLLLLLLFIYSVLGVQLFAKVGYNKTYDEHANFRTFENGLLTLFRFTTGEGWGIYMFDAYEQVDGCVSDPPFDDGMCGFNDRVGCTELNGCGSVMMFPFLLTFTIIVSMVLFNLFVGIIIEGFQNANEDNLGLTSDDYKSFCKHWAKWDDNGDLFITIEALEEFVATLPSPLGLKDIHPAHAEIVKYLSQLDMNVYQLNGQSHWVHFKDVLIALTTQAIKSTMGGELDHLKQSIRMADDTTYKKTLASGATVITQFRPNLGEDEGSDVFKLRQFYAAVLVQHTLRHNRMVKMAQKARQKYMEKFYPDMATEHAKSFDPRTNWKHRQSIKVIAPPGDIEMTSLLPAQHADEYTGISYRDRKISESVDAAGAGTGSASHSSRGSEVDAHASPFKSVKGTGDGKSGSADKVEEEEDEEDANNMVQDQEVTPTVASLFHFISPAKPANKRSKGTKTFSNGDVYEGEMLNGVMDGKGTYKYHEGAEYIGQLKRGMREGYGEYTSVNGERYIGYFHKNKRHGEGTKVHLDGRVEAGQWSYGHFIG